MYHLHGFFLARLRLVLTLLVAIGSCDDVREMSGEDGLFLYVLTMFRCSSFLVIPSGTFRRPNAFANSCHPAGLKFFLWRRVSLIKLMTLVLGIVRPSKTIWPWSFQPMMSLLAFNFFTSWSALDFIVVGMLSKISFSISPGGSGSSGNSNLYCIFTNV